MSEPSPSSSFPVGRALLFVMLLVLVAWAIIALTKPPAPEQPVDLQRTMFSRLFVRGESPTLDKTYQDADGDLVADPPQDPAKWIDPPEINFCYVASTDADAGAETWKELIAALSERLGRPVKLTPFAFTEEQLRALKAGELHVTAFSTGEVQSAVNTAGFMPLACFADEEGNFHYTMKLIVPADSKIEEVEDLRGKRVTYVRPRSNSGCTAALVMLMKDHGLQPQRDYDWNFSYGHETSIKGVAAKEFEAAAVAGDILERMTAAGEPPAEKIRVIYQSPPYPSGAIGCVYNLTPELRDGIRETLQNFEWAGTGLQETYGPSGSKKFVPVSYKDDWAPVREINQAGAKIMADLEKPAA
jgi:phosphonate transport system substrate-binding protein